MSEAVTPRRGRACSHGHKHQQIPASGTSKVHSRPPSSTPLVGVLVGGGWWVPPGRWLALLCLALLPACGPAGADVTPYERNRLCEATCVPYAWSLHHHEYPIDNVCICHGHVACEAAQ